MKIALISDIHSNIEALKAVLEDIDSRSPDRIYCLGDLIGYLNKPNEVVELVRSRGITSIIGNNDEDIVFENYKENEIKKWTNSVLKYENIKYIRSLPKTISLDVEDTKILLVHGSPSSNREYLREGKENTLKIVEKYSGDILVAGHTHIPYVDYLDHKLMINTGSVGKPKYGTLNASYVIIEIVDGDVEARIAEVEYDIEKVVSSLEEDEFPREIIDALREGR